MTLRKVRRIFDVQGGAGNDTDQFGVCRTPNSGNCSGIEGWFWIGKPETDLWRRINPNQNLLWTTEVKAHYSVWDKAGGLYFGAQREKSAMWKAFNLLWGSKSALDGEYNMVNVLSENGAYSEIERIRRAANYDDLSPETHPWLFHRAWCTNKIGKTYDTPKGKIVIPLFDMRDFLHGVGDITGNWCRNEYLGDVVGELPPTPPPVDPPADVIQVIVTAVRSKLRQRPNDNSPKIDPVARRGDRFIVYSQTNGWGYTGQRGWILLAHTKKA